MKCIDSNVTFPWICVSCIHCDVIIMYHVKNRWAPNLLSRTINSIQFKFKRDRIYTVMEPAQISRIDELERYNRDVTELIADYWRKLDTLPPLCDKEPGFLLDRLPQDAPENPDCWEDVLADIKDLIVPGVNHFSNIITDRELNRYW